MAQGTVVEHIPARTARTATPEGLTVLADRVDPYWDLPAPVTGSGGHLVAWMGRTGAEKLDELGLKQWPSATPTVPLADAVGSLTDRRQRVPALGALNALGVVGMWRTVSSEQLAAFTGIGALAGRSSKIMRACWESGLVQRGHIVAEGLIPFQRGLPTLWRPDSEGPASMLRRTLTLQEWVGVAANKPWGSGGQYDRHNLLSTELSLRVAENCPIAAVFGERLADATDVAGPNIPFRPGMLLGDAVWVRPDGLRVVLELAADPIRREEKVRRWVSVLESDRGLAVLFVDAARPHQGLRQATAGGVGRHLKAAISAGSHATLAATAARVADRLLVVSWRQWFPQSGHASDKFGVLTAWKSTGTAHGKDDFVPVDLADPFQVVCDDPERGLAAIANAPLLYGVPHWQRETLRAADLGPAAVQLSRLIGR